MRLETSKWVTIVPQIRMLRFGRSRNWSNLFKPPEAMVLPWFHSSFRPVIKCHGKKSDFSYFLVQPNASFDTFLSKSVSLLDHIKLSLWQILFIILWYWTGIQSEYLFFNKIVKSTFVYILLLCICYFTIFIERCKIRI